jgi:tetratricopeptide (TPR) repeat protein
VELGPRYRRAIGMRLFEAPARVAERRGIVAAESGDSERARAAYQEAIEGYGEGAAPLAVRLGLAHTSYALGADDAAIRGYRTVLRDGASLPRVAKNLAHALARRGQDLGEAERLVEQLLRDAGEATAELKLLRALVHARRGQRGPARKLLKQTASAEGDAIAERRAEVEAALEGG